MRTFPRAARLCSLPLVTIGAMVALAMLDPVLLPVGACVLLSRRAGRRHARAAASEPQLPAPSAPS